MMSIVNDCEKTSDLGESAITSDDANIVTFNEKDSTIENSPEERCSSQGSTEMIAPQKLSCEMCHNYETTLTKLQETERELKEKLAAAQHLADRYQTELSGERVYRNELESKMTTLSMEAEADRKKAFRENDELSKKLERVEKRLEKLKEEQNNKLDILKEQFSEMDRNMQYLSRKYIVRFVF
ncbi:hypothetical protein AB6A40_005912 [Gnathostoma spinigerum]|uniref:Rabaptin GTPase-Rab5 binding domain-containing protein n=1 Tax=Gnathostoma spinigerum TaxID=75299 RepID=A0ABD6EH10_9BILA